MTSDVAKLEDRFAGVMLGTAVGDAIGLRSVKWMGSLARGLAEVKRSKTPRALPFLWPAILLRNVLFLVVVLMHGVRRVFPPY